MSGGSAPWPGRIVIPWFALGFIAVAGLNSLALLPKPVVDAAIDVDTALLAMEMAALGLTTHSSAIRNAGLKPLSLAALLFAWLVGGGIVIDTGITALFAWPRRCRRPRASPRVALRARYSSSCISLVARLSRPSPPPAPRDARVSA